MTTDTTDAEAIARIIEAEIEHDIKDNIAWANGKRAANAILSYLASRREAQEPVAWRDVERKFYHSDWPLTKLLEARNGGLLTDEGEAWTYVFSHKDGIGGEYDLLRRREPAPPSPAPAPAGEVERLRKALAFYANPEIYKPHPHGPAFDRRDLSDVARAALNGVRHD